MSRRLPYAHPIQNVRLVWLDEVNNENCISTISQLKEVVNNVNTFTDIDECVDFISDITKEKIFMITSGPFGRETIPVTHEMAQVSTIYILWGNKARHENWSKQWPKVKGVFSDSTSICEPLKWSVQRCDQNSIPMSFVVPNSDTIDQNLDRLDPSFMYTQILKEIILTIDFEPKHIQEFMTYCRKQFVDNTTELKHVDKLEREYHEHVPIWWYTTPSFLFSMLYSNFILNSMLNMVAWILASYIVVKVYLKQTSITCSKYKVGSYGLTIFYLQVSTEQSLSPMPKAIIIIHTWLASCFK